MGSKTHATQQRLTWHDSRTTPGNGNRDEQRQQHPEGALLDPEQWRYTPSAIDASNFNFSSFLNHPSGEVTPAPGDFNNMFHSQAGDLHTPGVAFNLGTPLSTDDSHPLAAVGLDAFHPHLLPPQEFHHLSQFQQQPSFAPSTFLHQDSGYDTMEQQASAFRGPNQQEQDQQSDMPEIPVEHHAMNTMAQPSNAEK